MPSSRRRQRTLDPLANTNAVRSICDQFRARLKQLDLETEPKLRRFLYAVQHVESYSATATKAGRRSQWSREVLISAASTLRSILQRETEGRVSVSRFILQYLQTLSFPSDVTDALNSGEITLQEAIQLARLTSKRMACAPATARRRREDLLRTHLTVHGSQNALRTRVKELLGEAQATGINAENMTGIVARVDEMLEFDPNDTRHLFWEDLKAIFYAMLDVQPEELDDETLDEMQAATAQVLAILHRIERERQRKALSQAKKLAI